MPLDTKPLTSKPSTVGTQLRIPHFLRLTLCLDGIYANALDFCRFRLPPPKAPNRRFRGLPKNIFSGPNVRTQRYAQMFHLQHRRGTDRNPVTDGTLRHGSRAKIVTVTPLTDAS